MAKDKKTGLTIDMGELEDWTPEERRKAQYAASTERYAETRKRIAAKYQAKRDAERKKKGKKE